jgi:UDP-2,3-diacylglucosamine pyrophosphatase LpxH
MQAFTFPRRDSARTFAAQQRFTFGESESLAPRRYRAGWISDAHLGIPGNHDELVADFCGTYGNIEIKQRAIHVTTSGERILIIHGHELDVVVSGSGRMKWLAFAGDLGYQFLLSLNPLINFVRRRFGLGYWSLSAYAKRRVKDAVSFIGKFEAAVAHYAERYHVDAVLCGHIHSAAIREFGNVTYYNCGDWVESCTALVEGDDGILSLVNYHPFSAVRSAENASVRGRNDEIRMTNVELISKLEWNKNTSKRHKQLAGRTR